LTSDLTFRLISDADQIMEKGKLIEKRMIRLVKNYIGKHIDDENRYPSRILLNKKAYQSYRTFKKADILSLKLKNSNTRITISKSENLDKEIKLIP